MGILKYALVGNYKGFYKKLGEISKKTGKSQKLMFIDTAFCAFTLGSGLQDYLNYKFYEKSFKERRTYLTIGKMNKAYKTLAPYKYADFISNKVNFHKNYAKFTKRSCVSSNDSFKKFEEFINNHESFVLKPLNGLGGSNVTKIISKDIKSKKEFYNDLKEKNFFIEEYVNQDEKWGKLSPKSTNTLRIVTTVVGDNVKIVFAGARIGSGKTIADNFHQGGLGVLVDIDKGILVGTSTSPFSASATSSAAVASETQPQTAAAHAIFLMFILLSLSLLVVSNLCFTKLIILVIANFKSIERSPAVTVL